MNEVVSSVFRDDPKRPVIWKRKPEADITCSICAFEYGHGTAFAYVCVNHHRSDRIGQVIHHCPVHQREVSPLMFVGEPVLEQLLGEWKLVYWPDGSVSTG